MTQPITVVRSESQEIHTAHVSLDLVTERVLDGKTSRYSRQEGRFQPDHLSLQWMWDGDRWLLTSMVASGPNIKLNGHQGAMRYYASYVVRPIDQKVFDESTPREFIEMSREHTPTSKVGA